MDTSANRIRYLYTNVNESPYTGQYGSSARQPASSSYHPHHHQASHPVGNLTFGAGSESMFSTSPANRSRDSSISSCTSYASNRTLNHHILNLEYDLPCDLGFAGCRVRFRAVDYRDWINHSISHFGEGPLPPRAICTFCDAVFKPLARDNQSLDLNWRERMKHIATHFERLEPETQLRPDFGVIDHMWKNDLLSREDWEVAKRYTERPHGCDGIVSRRHLDVGGEEEDEEDRGSRVYHNSREESREIKKRGKKYRSSRGHREKR